MSLEDYTGELSDVALQKFGNESSFMGTLLGIPAAAVVDTGISIWNSVTPERYNYDTHDVLQGMNQNLATIYNENEGVVKALSFVGGVLLPAGAALKGMGALRAGVKGASWFSQAGQVERLAGIKTAYEGSKGASNVVNGLVRNDVFAQVGNAVVDSAVLEGVLYMTMNAHPYMEDYVKDPWKNAGINMLIGVPLITAGNLIGGFRAIKDTKQGVDMAAAKTALEGTKQFEITQNLSEQMAVRANNADNWKEMLKNPDLNERTKALIEINMANSAAESVLTFDKMISPSFERDLAALPLEVRQGYKNILIDKMVAEPTRFAGIDSISFYKAGELADITKASPAGRALLGGTILPGEKIPLITSGTTAAGEDFVKSSRLIYSPSHDAFLVTGDMKAYGKAVDAGFTEANLLNKVPKNSHLSPNEEFWLGLEKTTSAHVDAHYLQQLKYYDELPAEALKNVRIGNGDLGGLQGFLARMQKEMGPSGTVKLSDVSLEYAGKPISITDAHTLLQDTKILKAEELLAKGVPPEVVSTYVNMPVDTVRAIGAGGATHDILAMDYRLYADASVIPDALKLENRSLVLKTNMKKVPHAQVRANIGAQLMNQAEDQIKAGIFAGAAQTSPHFAAWNDYFNGSDFNYLRDIMRQNLSKAVNTAMGTKFITSSDMALRDMEDLGRIATNLGKQINELHFQSVTRAFAPVRNTLAVVAKDDASRTEYNIAKHVYAKETGYLEYKNGKILVQDKDTPMIAIGKDANGKDIMARNMKPAQYQGVDFEIKTPEVRELFDWHQQIGRELYHQANTLRSVPGVGRLADRGLWIPSFNPKDKFIAYVIDKNTMETMLLHGKTEADLQDAIKAFSTKTGVQVGVTHDIIQHGTEQEMYNILKGRHDPMFMRNADVGMVHGGASAEARISTSAEALVDAVNAIENQLRYNIGSMVELQLSDVMDHLRTVSKITQAPFKDMPVNRFTKQPKDAAKVLMNTILGKNNANDIYMWQGTNQIYEAILEKGLGTIAKVMEPILDTVKGKIGRGQTLSDLKYDELGKELQRRGIPFIFKDFEEAAARQAFHTDRTVRTEALAPRITVLMNTLAATALLKVGELGQAYVNAISLPILMTSEISSKLPAKFLGAELVGNPQLGVMKTMFNGLRFIFTDEGRRVTQLGKNENIFKAVVSEVDDLFRTTRSLEPGAISKLETGARSKIVEFLSAGTNLSEEMVRHLSFSTGWYISKEAYPTLSDSGRMIFARDFMDRTIGNYTASQRPTMFQGTFGVAMGLFQTYMLTMAQSMYRHLEKQEFKALAKMMLVQGGIFGAKSLPGFNLVSEYIGEHFSDQNVDLVTGTFRALPTKLAESIIYGLPSSFGQAAVTSRGDIQPRIPDPTLGINAIPAVNLTAQAWQAMSRVAKALYSSDQTAGQGLMEALSVQSISRPIARLSELASGQSITGRGNLIAGPAEIWTWPSVVARALGTRPISEARARDALHLNSMYGSFDRDNRAQISMKLRSHMRGGTLNDEVVSELANEYMRTGSPTGWNSVVNSAIGQTMLPAESTVRNYLAPDSPTLAMINNMY